MKNKSGTAFLALILIITGVVVTLENFRFINGISRHWPVLMLILGTGFSLLYFQKQRKDPVLIWLGAFIGLLGIFFYYLNFTTWKSLSHDWPVFLLVTGISFIPVAASKKKMIYVLSSLSFITLFLIFFLVFTVSSKLWPLSFLFLGVDLLIIEYVNRIQNIKSS
ncbi:MAG: hypothetical protein JW723_15615 [Bacteroidales bacterium]|nr:hypothetical protein [Bacteroidales bacterium]